MDLELEEINSTNMLNTLVLVQRGTESAYTDNTCNSMHIGRNFDVDLISFLILMYIYMWR